MCHAYEAVTSDFQPLTPLDESLGYAVGHGIHFRVCIQAVHQRATKLLGLSAIDSFDEPYELDEANKRNFKIALEDYERQLRQERQRRQAWDNYFASASG